MTHPFVSGNRAVPGVIRLSDPQTSPTWIIRVAVAETWDAVRIEATPEVPVMTIKQAALEALLMQGDDADAYDIKYGGALIEDERVTLRDAGAKDGSMLVVIGRRKRPVR